VIQEELTLGSSETYDTTQPTTLHHITEDLNPHLGSAYKMWWDIIHLPHFLSPNQLFFQERWCWPTCLWCHTP